MRFLKKLLPNENNTALKRYRKKVAEINAIESDIKTLSDEALKAKTQEFKAKIADGKTLDDILVEAFAVVREAAVRTMEMRHYDVQLIGGMTIHDGKIAEMRTGEGKTLTGTLAVYLNALEGKGVHVVTVNDYLAKRDADWMGQLYDFLGLTVGVIAGQNTSYLYDRTVKDQTLDEERDDQGYYKIFGEYLREAARKEAYQADITYGTNNEFGFDYLRDNTQLSKYGLVQRELNFVLIDEIDSILIDEARVPLILSRPSAQPAKFYIAMAQVAKRMQADTHFEVDEKLRAVTMTQEGIEYAEKLLKMPDLYTAEKAGIVHHLESALKAKALFTKDKDYVVKEGNVVIVDPFTGRMQEGRRYSDGLHQALEAKEGVDIQKESQTMASITYQNYFKFYTKLSGMTGTGASSQEEFHKVYGLDVVVIPTNKEIARRDNDDLIFRTEKGKFKAIARTIREKHEIGQPVLVGTGSIEKNELLAQYLTEEGVPHQVLNAKNHEAEGMITAQAGKKGAVTIATNMAGRGVDIKLGGNPATKDQEQEIKDLGGLFVLGTERMEARRVDDQLRGRAGRQGDPGETQFFVCLEDAMMRVFGNNAMLSGLLTKMDMPEDQPIQHKMISRSLEKAQERLEGKNFDTRQFVLQFGDVIAKQRDSIYATRRKILLEQDNAEQVMLNELFAQKPELKEIYDAKRVDFGEKEFDGMLRQVILQFTDQLWMQHLQVMNRAQQSVNLRAYGQREPIVEYKKEASRLFKQLQATRLHNIGQFITNLDIEALKQQQEQLVKQRAEQARKRAKETGAQLQTTSGAVSSSGSTVSGYLPVSDVSDLGRNERIVISKEGKEKTIKAKQWQELDQDGWQIIGKLPPEKS